MWGHSSLDFCAMLVAQGLHHFPTFSVALERLPDCMRSCSGLRLLVEKPRALEFEKEMVQGW